MYSPPNVIRINLERRTPNNGNRTVTADLNTKVGREDTCRGLAGERALYLETSNSEGRVTGSARRKRLINCYKCFLHKDVHKVTWTSPDANMLNQTDHASIETKEQKKYLSRLKFQREQTVTMIISWCESNIEAEL